MNAELHIDGGARGNPGPAAIGIVLRDLDRGALLHAAGYFLGVATNNEAEYRALIRGLHLARELGARQLQIRSDSELLVKQILGAYRVKSPGLKPLYEEAQLALLGFDSWQIQHVYREQNRHADDLVNQALDRRKDVIAATVPANGQPSTGPEGEPLAPRDGGAGPVPRWTATFLEETRPPCPAPCPPGRVFAFGPATPTGLCIHAAQTIFDEEPAHWPGRNQQRHDAACAYCKARIRIELKEAE